MMPILWPGSSWYGTWRTSKLPLHPWVDSPPAKNNPIGVGILLVFICGPLWIQFSCGDIVGNLYPMCPPSVQVCRIVRLVVHWKTYTDIGIVGNGVTINLPPYCISSGLSPPPSNTRCAEGSALYHRHNMYQESYLGYGHSWLGGYHVIPVRTRRPHWHA